MSVLTVGKVIVGPFLPVSLLKEAGVTWCVCGPALWAPRARQGWASCHTRAPSVKHWLADPGTPGRGGHKVSDRGKVEPPEALPKTRHLASPGHSSNGQGEFLPQSLCGVGRKPVLPSTALRLSPGRPLCLPLCPGSGRRAAGEMNQRRVLPSSNSLLFVLL